MNTVCKSNVLRVAGRHIVILSTGHLLQEVNDAAIRPMGSEGNALAPAARGPVVRGADHRLALPRIFVTNDDLATLKAKVLGAWD